MACHDLGKGTLGVRPCIQRAFLAWLAEAQPRLERQVIVRRQTGRMLTFGFDVGSAVLDGWLGHGGIMVAADDGETCWDLLISLDVVAERCDGGVICCLCLSEERRVFARREELWRDHCLSRS